MEACGGAHYLGAALRDQGHQARLIPPQFVKPFVKSNKNDANDSEAIAEAVQRPRMRFVPIKTQAQLDRQALHRVRSRLMRRRLSLTNQFRAFLLERGITVRTGIGHLRRGSAGGAGPGPPDVLPRMAALIERLVEEWRAVEAEMDRLNAEIVEIAVADPAAQRLLTIPGVGPLTATAMVAAVRNGAAFAKGREFAAWLGLVPRQCSTGGQPRLLGISKRGNNYLRRLFIHGARSVLMRVPRERLWFGDWLTQLQARAHRNTVAVALAARLARIAWAVLALGTRIAPRRSSPAPPAYRSGKDAPTRAGLGNASRFPLSRSTAAADLPGLRSENPMTERSNHVPQA